MTEFTATWRFTVIVLAIACAGNALLILSAQEITALTRAISIISAGCAAALLASLWLKIRRFTLFLACVTMLMQAYETTLAPIELWAKIRLDSFCIAFALISFGAWLQAMKNHWPQITRVWRVALL